MELPELILFEDYDNSWNDYLNALYAFFKRDFVVSKPLFRGKKLALKRHPLDPEGREVTFWHFISEGKNESERRPDFRRCERIKWPRHLIENETHEEIKVWENERRGEKRILLFNESESYLVILAQRKDYILPWTAYLVEQPRRKRKLLKEYDDYKKKLGSPPQRDPVTPSTPGR